MLEEPLVLPRIKRQRMLLRDLGLFLDLIKLLLKVLTIILIWHPLEFLKVTAILFEVLQVLLLVGTDDGRQIQGLFNLHLSLL